MIEERKKMSILEVKIIATVSVTGLFWGCIFPPAQGEHIGLVGANGEGKSTFMSIVTGKMLPDEGKVEWSKSMWRLVIWTSMLCWSRAKLSVMFCAQPLTNFSRQKVVSTTSIWAWLKKEPMLMPWWKKWVSCRDRLESRDFYTLDAKIDEGCTCSGRHGLWYGEWCDGAIWWATDQGSLG